MAFDPGILIGLVGGGGIAGLAAVWQNARATKITTAVEENKSSIDGFDKLTGRLETRLANSEAEMAKKDDDHMKEIVRLTAECAARIAVKDERIAELERRSKK